MNAITLQVSECIVAAWLLLLFGFVPVYQLFRSCLRDYFSFFIYASVVCLLLELVIGMIRYKSLFL